jgi:hypothetical protein
MHLLCCNGSFQFSLAHTHTHIRTRTLSLSHTHIEVVIEEGKAPPKKATTSFQGLIFFTQFVVSSEQKQSQRDICDIIGYNGCQIITVN